MRKDFIDNGDHHYHQILITIFGVEYDTEFIYDAAQNRQLIQGYH